MRLELESVACGYGRRTVLSDISFAVEAGENLCLLGPNGVGKTTLFRTILGLISPHGGRVLLNGQDLVHYSRRGRAQHLAYVPQAHTPPFPFRAVDVVLTGRTAHIGMTSTPSPRDYEIAEEALETLGASPLADRIYTELSGGERQLILIARALAQRPDVLIMDEPSASLDFGNQTRLLSLISSLVKRQDLSVVMSSHFPNQAFACATKVALVKDGGLLAVGDPDDVLTEDNLEAIYGIPVSILESDREGRVQRVCTPSLS
ncbi:MAG: ABC transporter ATP-binding protein [Gaiellales bacterium]|nr:ABC transporter ATP-binding protein [Gaiellales bacterium]